MAWVRIESSVARHRKFQQAGPAASWLWICGLAYCQEGLTDGFIPVEALPYLGVKSPVRQAAALVAAGLWQACPGGWQVHDYLDHNREASTIRRVQDDRRKAGSEGGRASALMRRVLAVQQGAEASPKQVASATTEANLKQGAEANLKQPANPATDRTATDLYVRTDLGTSPGSAARNTHPVENLSKPGERLRMARAELATAPADDGNFRVISRIAREILQQCGPLDEGDLVEAVKAACAQRGIDYGRHPDVAEDVVHRACAVELFKFTHPEIAQQAAT